MNAKELLDLVSQWDACQPARDWLASLDPETDFIQIVKMNENHHWFLWLEFVALDIATERAGRAYKAAIADAAKTYAKACHLAIETYGDAVGLAIETYNMEGEAYDTALEEADRACDAAFTAAKKAYDAAAAPYLLALLQSIR